MNLSEILMVVATALSPLIAVQVTRYLADRNAERGRKLYVFKTLMATRAYSLSQPHIEALNSIDLEFSGNTKEEKIVRDSWQRYLEGMAQCLGYDFDKTQIKNASYSPVLHGRIEFEQERVRAMTLELLEGKRSLPMHVTNLPLPPPASQPAPGRIEPQ